MSTANKHEYEVNLEWLELRKGQMRSPSLNEIIEVATPPEFKNGMPGIWSPEHLLVAAVNSCLMTTFLSIAENSGLKFNSFYCKAVGLLETIEKNMMISEIRLYPQINISNKKDRDRALRIVQKAEENCLISHSVKSSIFLYPEITVREVMVNEISYTEGT